MQRATQKPLGEDCQLDPFLPGIGQEYETGHLEKLQDSKQVASGGVPGLEKDTAVSEGQEKGQVSEPFSNLILTELVGQMSALNTGLQELSKSQAVLRRELSQNKGIFIGQSLPPSDTSTLAPVPPQVTLPTSYVPVPQQLQQPHRQTSNIKLHVVSLYI